MTRLDYYIEALKIGLPTKLNWIYGILTIPEDYYKNEFFHYQPDGFYAILNNQPVLIDDYIPNTPLFNIQDLIKLPKDTFPLIIKDITTTIGISLTNYLLIYKPFKTKFKYINGSITPKQLESKIAPLLVTDKLTVQEYKDFINAAQFVEQLSDIVVVSGNEHIMVPPPGLSDYKIKLKKKYKEKYGEDWYKDVALVGLYEKELKDYLLEYVKDDPTFGKIMSGKVLNNSWAKKFLTFGIEFGFDDTGTKATQVDRSLLEGLPFDDKEQLVATFNSSRTASYSRGAETVNGGTTFKNIARATNRFKIDKDDCKVTYGEYYDINESNYKKLIGRYIIKNKKSTIINDEQEAKQYVGKKVELRSPKYCKANGESYCKKCMGRNVSLNEEGIILASANVSFAILQESLKKMHNSSISVVSVNIQDVIF